jgi:hypothetical protein
MPWVECAAVTSWIPVTALAALLYVVGIPVLLVALIGRYRHDLGSPVVVRRYSMFLKHTRPDCYWWAVSQYPVKVAIAAVTTLVPPRMPALYFVLMLFILQSQFAALLSTRPYNSVYDNRLSLFTVFGLLTAASTGLYVTATSGNGHTADVIVVQSVAAVVNLAVLVLFEVWRTIVVPVALKVWRVVLRKFSAGPTRRAGSCDDSDATIPLTRAGVTSYSAL